MSVPKNSGFTLWEMMVAIGIIAIYFLPWYDNPQAYTDDYGIAGLFDILMICIRWMTAAFAMLTTAFLIIAKRVEPGKTVPS